MELHDIASAADSGLAPAPSWARVNTTMDMSLPEFLAALRELETRELAFLLVFYGGQIAAVLFVLRSALVMGARSFGIYHPDMYRLWPRTGMRSALWLWVKVSEAYERIALMGKRSTGGFASMLGVLVRLYRPGLVHVGRLCAYGFGLLQPVGLKVSRHLFMLAQTGAGKTTALITIISTWRGSVFLIDPKAQVTNALRQHDKSRRWIVIDPYQLSPIPSAGYNPFDSLKAAMQRHDESIAVLWAFRMGEALIITPAGSRSPFFTDAARGFLAGAILHVLSTHPESDHNLPAVRDLIVNGYRVYDDDGDEIETKDEERHELLYRMMGQNPAFEGTVGGAVSALKNASGETAGNVRSTLLEQTKWLDIPQARRVLRKSSIPLVNLKTRDDLVLAFTAPVLSVREELAPLSRLLTNMLSYDFQDEPRKKGQCLVVIDELPSQGHNATLEVTIPVARSQGQTVLGIAQNLELMRNAYPKTYNIFTGEADAVLWMGINHKETAEHLSALLGKRTLVEVDQYSEQRSYREVDVLSTDQVSRLLGPDSGNLIVTRAGGRALRLKNEPYFKALPVWAYAPDPDHGESWPRRITRSLFDRRSKSNDKRTEE